MRPTSQDYCKSDGTGRMHMSPVSSLLRVVQTPNVRAEPRAETLSGGRMTPAHACRFCSKGFLRSRVRRPRLRYTPADVSPPSLAPGTRLGPYEVVSPLGAGGMGEVYRARDSRLNRDVALKILPAEVAADPSRRQRFEIEARAVAALSHPNIVAVYDVGEGYIVSELVDGEPLRGARFGLRKTLDIAAQIAGGLAAAHAAGVVHRDLKPDNILLTRDGRAKILDFGLARMTQASGHPDATMPAPLTGPGVVMGTVGYMSPEQVRGLDADHRSDIFSFGVVLHEMLGGARPFDGETAVDTMQAVLRQDAPDLPSTVPAGVRQVVSHCLEKDPAHRFQSARDLGFALRALAQGDSSSGSHGRGVPGSARARAPARGWRRVWPCSPSPPPPSSPGKSRARQPPQRGPPSSWADRQSPCTRAVRRMAGSWRFRPWWTGRCRWA